MASRPAGRVPDTSPTQIRPSGSIATPPPAACTTGNGVPGSAAPVGSKPCSLINGAWARLGVQVHVASRGQRAVVDRESGKGRVIFPVGQRVEARDQRHGRRRDGGVEAPHLVGAGVAHVEPPARVVEAKGADVGELVFGRGFGRALGPEAEEVFVRRRRRRSRPRARSECEHGQRDAASQRPLPRPRSHSSPVSFLRRAPCAPPPGQRRVLALYRNLSVFVKAPMWIARTRRRPRPVFRSRAAR